MVGAGGKGEIPILPYGKSPAEKAQAPEFVSVEHPPSSGSNKKDTGIGNISLNEKSNHEKEEGDLQVANEDDLVITLADNNVVDEPKEGMLFSSEKAVQNYYTEYARCKGFGVIRRTSKRGDDGTLTWLMLACARSRKCKSRAKNPLRRPLTKKIECQARIHIAIALDGTCRLGKVVLEHNHQSGPAEVRLARRKKRLDSYVKRRPELNDPDGINVNINSNSFGAEADLTFSEKDFACAKSHVQNYKMMCDSFSEIADLACDNSDNVVTIMRAICNLKEKIKKNRSNCGSNQLSQQDHSVALSNCNVDNQASKESNKVLSPLAVRRRGRPPLDRKDSLDQAARNVREKLTKQTVAENHTTKQKREKVNENEQVEYDGSDACPPSSNVTHLVNEIGTQGSIMGNPSIMVGGGFMRSVFNYPNLSPSQLQGQSLQLWRVGCGTENFLPHNFNGNQSQTNPASYIASVDDCQRFQLQKHK